MSKAAVGAIVAVMVGLFGVAVFVAWPDSDDGADDRAYLAALEASGLDDKFSSDEMALSNARFACKKLEEAGTWRGSEAQALAVGIYCPEHAAEFRVTTTTTTTTIPALTSREWQACFSIDALLQKTFDGTLPPGAELGFMSSTGSFLLGSDKKDLVDAQRRMALDFSTLNVVTAPTSMAGFMGVCSKYGYRFVVAEMYPERIEARS